MVLAAIQVRPRLNLGDLKHLIIVGGPIMFAGCLNMSWSAVNRTLILQFMGTKALGLYFAGMLSPALLLLPIAVQQITYPRITEIYARSGNVRDLMAVLWRPTAVLTVSMTAGIALLWLVLPTATRILLPKYVEGVEATRWASLDAVMISLLTIRSIFFTMRKQHYYLIATIFGIVVYLAAVFLLIQGGLHLEAFPQAFLAGRVGQTAACYFFVYGLYKGERSSRKNAA